MLISIHLMRLMPSNRSLSASALFFLSFFLLKWYTQQEPGKTKASEETLNSSNHGDVEGKHMSIEDYLAGNQLQDISQLRT